MHKWAGKSTHKLKKQVCSTFFNIKYNNSDSENDFTFNQFNLFVITDYSAHMAYNNSNLQGNKKKTITASIKKHHCNVKCIFFFQGTHYRGNI